MSWIPSTVSNDAFKLPARPGIRRRIYVDTCKFCGSVHLDVKQAVVCREAALGRSPSD